MASPEGDLQIVLGVARPTELRLGFRHHALEVLNHVGRNLEARGGFGGNRHQRGRPASQGKGAKVFRRDQRRVHQGLERHFAKLHRVGRGFMRRRKRSIVFPSRRQTDTREKRIAIVRQTRRVEHDQPPIDHELIVGGANVRLKPLLPQHAGEVEIRPHLAHALGDIHMEDEDIELIAMPGERHAAGRERQPDDLAQRTARTVFAGNPFGIREGKDPGSRREGHVGMKHSRRRSGCVELETNRRAVTAASGEGACEHQG